jgi:hypothetical protein
VTTPFAIFVDNDVKVSAGWLDALEECAIDTGAAVVAPTIITDELGHTEVHHTGGEARIVERDGVRILEETMWDHGESTDGVANLSRSVTGEPEFHCVFVDTDWYRRVGGLDEELLSLFEHTDFAMRIREAGGTVWREPRALVSYGRPRFIKQPDRAYYTLRWSERWNLASRDRFRTVWRLDNDPYVPMTNWARVRRRYGYRPLTSPFHRMGRFGRPVLDVVDRVAQRRVVSRWEQTKGNAIVPRRAHIATWQRADAVAAPGGEAS